ncbi:MAG: DUF5615 family PIN-like protein [Anaerolineae bacterium]|nr:DUF5615 family PIN-like protein [Anaerolineae bacterium]
MKLLLDNNLSPRLVNKLADLFPNSSHVALLGLDAASDLEVWNAAQRDVYYLVSKDSDFNEILEAKGFPPKVIWIRIGNCTTATLFKLLQTHYETILDFGADESAGLLELQ